MNTAIKKIKKFFSKLGPGFITGISDDDPSGIATFAQTGAQFGYTQLWTVLFSFPLMAAIQEICGRTGLVTGMGLSRIIKKHYAKPILFFAITTLLIANTINIGANLGAMAASARLLIGIPFIFWLIAISITTIVLEIFVPYKIYANFLKYLALSVISYVVVAFAVDQDWVQIFKSTVTPTIRLEKPFIMNIVAILGTTISPYLFFWLANEEVEESLAHKKLIWSGFGRPKVATKDVKQMRLDTFIGMSLSHLIMFFIIATSASTLNLAGIYEIQTADQAAEVLRPIAGDFVYLLFAGGIIGTGLLAIPVLAGSAAYAVSEAMHWKEGLDRSFNKASAFYIVIIIATLIGMLVNFSPIPPFRMLYYTAILNGVAAPPIMILILMISNNKKIMGQHTNSWISNLLGWLAVIVMSASAIALFLVTLD